MLAPLANAKVSARKANLIPRFSHTAIGEHRNMLSTGTFDVKLTPQPDEIVGRMTIDKQFHGDIEGTSKGQMLAVQGEVKGSAGYVAMERITGTLGGRKGSFALQHSGTMNRGVPGLSVTVVPDSGTDELTGLSGKMNIIIASGKHSYEFEYSILPSK
jgi:hypothetical protein